MATRYIQNPRNHMANGLTLLQINPDLAVQLDVKNIAYGWLYELGVDDRWGTVRKLDEHEIEVAQDQAADMAVLQGTWVRAG